MFAVFYHCKLKYYSNAEVSEATKPLKIIYSYAQILLYVIAYE